MEREDSTIPTWQLEIWRYNLEENEVVPTYEPMRDAFISLLYEVMEHRAHGIIEDGLDALARGQIVKDPIHE